MNSDEAQRAVNEQLIRLTPNAWSSIVAIVMEHGTELWQIGTGTLFQIADVGFIVSARHVVQSPIERRKVIGFSATAGFVQATAPWTVSADYQNEGLDPDPFDIAVYRLPPDSMARFAGKTFLRLGDVTFEEPEPTAVYTLFGFPAVWTDISRADDERLIVTPLEFTSYTYTGSVDGFDNYRRRFHILMDATPHDVTGPDGSPRLFTGRDGESVEFPRGLHGISGCCVWRIGSLRVPLDRWEQTPARVAAVETGVYQTSQVIRATRWVAVATAIYKSCPDLRSAIELHQ